MGDRGKNKIFSVRSIKCFFFFNCPAIQQGKRNDNNEKGISPNFSVDYCVYFFKNWWKVEEVLGIGIKDLLNSSRAHEKEIIFLFPI